MNRLSRMFWLTVAAIIVVGCWTILDKADRL